MGSRRRIEAPDRQIALLAISIVVRESLRRPGPVAAGTLPEGAPPVPLHYLMAFSVGGAARPSRALAAAHATGFTRTSCVAALIACCLVVALTVLFDLLPIVDPPACEYLCGRRSRQNSVHLTCAVPQWSGSTDNFRCRVASYSAHCLAISNDLAFACRSQRQKKRGRSYATPAMLVRRGRF